MPSWGFYWQHSLPEQQMPKQMLPEVVTTATGSLLGLSPITHFNCHPTVKQRLTSRLLHQTWGLASVYINLPAGSSSACVCFRVSYLVTFWVTGWLQVRSLHFYPSFLHSSVETEPLGVLLELWMYGVSGLQKQLPRLDSDKILWWEWALLSDTAELQSVCLHNCLLVTLLGSWNIVVRIFHES